MTLAIVSHSQSPAPSGTNQAPGPARATRSQLFSGRGANPATPPPSVHQQAIVPAGAAAAPADGRSRAMRFGSGGDAAAPSENAVPAAAPLEAGQVVPEMVVPTPRRSRLQRFAEEGGDPAGADAGDAPTAFGAKTLAPEAGSVEITGVVERVRMFGEDWGMATIWTDERETVKVCGQPVRDLLEGCEYTLRGRYRTHPTHGESLDLSSATPHLRLDRVAIQRYIARNFTGVAERSADKFLRIHVDDAPDPAAALEALRQTLLTAPWTLDFTGVAKKAEFKTDEDASPVLAFVHRDLVLKLGGVPGMRDGVLKLLAAHMLQKVSPPNLDGSARILDPDVVNKCWAALLQDPYGPIEDVPGYAFRSADAIGSSVKIPRDAPVRLRALVQHALNEGCTRAGHVYLSEKQLKEAIASVDPRVDAEQTVQLGIDEAMVVVEEIAGGRHYYTPKLFDAEHCLAGRIARMCQSGKPLIKLTFEQAMQKVQLVARQISDHLSGGLDDSQARALAGILTSSSRLHTLTAGPGCGKTALMEVLQGVLKSRDFVFCGPTGKSAKVLNNRLMAHGRSAATIHSTLQGSGRSDFQVNEEDPLDQDVLVMDEGGMADVELADGVLAATNAQMHVVILGDPDQLPSIAPGSFLRDLLRVSAADHHRLSTTHRNSGGILEVIEQVRRGKIDCVDRPSVKFSHGLREASEQFMDVARSYANAVSRHGYENVILLMSLKKGEPTVSGWNTTYANAVLRDMCNPNAEKIPGTRLYVNDRIIIRANMRVALAVGSEPSVRARRRGEEEDDDSPQETPVVNGDTGTIVSFARDERNPRNAGARSLRLRLDDGRMVDFPGAALEALQHAYALTVHSGQGSEYKHVIAVATPGSASFINRTMLFTGLSRARDFLEVFGQDEVLRKIAATPMPGRNTGLVRRVLLELGDDEGVQAEEDADRVVEPTGRMRYRAMRGG